MNSPRLQQIDALRGIAALAVVLFHYSYGYQKFYSRGEPTFFVAYWGYLGVQLFFLISGFVIFMTLERTVRISDFVVSRFSRLYPTYWCALLLTTLAAALLGLPRLRLNWSDTLLNLLMFQRLFGVPDADASYWTLATELLFYAWALAVFAIGRLNWLRGLLALMMVLRLLTQLHVLTFPDIASTLLILPYASWFACGVAVYGLVHRGPRIEDLGLLLAAALVAGICDSPRQGLFAPAVSGLLYAAGSGRLPWLTWRPLLWLGSISYPLYLLHQYIGYAVMLRLDALGLSVDASIAIALAFMLLLATVLHRTAEQPAMDWIRRQWRQRRASDSCAA